MHFNDVNIIHDNPLSLPNYNAQLFYHHAVTNIILNQRHKEWDKKKKVQNQWKVYVTKTTVPIPQASDPRSGSSRAGSAQLQKPGHLNKVLSFLLTMLWHLHGTVGGRFMSLLKRWTCWVTAQAFDPPWGTAHRKRPLCGAFERNGKCVLKLSTKTNGVCSKHLFSLGGCSDRVGYKLATGHLAHLKLPCYAHFQIFNFCPIVEWSSPAGLIIKKTLSSTEKQHI